MDSMVSTVGATSEPASWKSAGVAWAVPSGFRGGAQYNVAVLALKYHSWGESNSSKMFSEHGSECQSKRAR
jgi:hypothetical protein